MDREIDSESVTRTPLTINRTVSRNQPCKRHYNWDTKGLQEGYPMAKPRKYYFSLSKYSGNRDFHDSVSSVNGSQSLRVAYAEKPSLKTFEDTPKSDITQSVCETSFAICDSLHHPPDVLIKLLRSCHLHHEQSPLKIVRASYQYMYDDTNSEYLDCVNSVSHIGHCHPAVVEAVSVTMDSVVNTCGWEIDYGDLRYPKELHQILPDHLDTFLFCNSGSEAVDLALQLARLYTNGTDAVVIDNAFHGSIGSIHHLSPKVSKSNNITKAEWVHIVTMPDLYRGPYQKDDPLAVDRYVADAQDLIDKAQHTGRKIACFIAEPMLTVPGCIVPPSTWLQEMYRMVRETGGLCIADEVQTGLGRVGSHFWSFQAQDVTPDILIMGKPVGNGYPMASVATSRDIAAVLGERIKEYKCTRVMDAVGCAVLEVLQQDQLMDSAAEVGTFLKKELVRLQKKHEYIGDVRGRGLMFGIEIVWSKQSKKPAREIADHIVNRMKEEYVIMANEGNSRNILMLLPPMCFTQENALLLIQRLDKVFTELPSHTFSRDHATGLPTNSVNTQPAIGTCEGRLGIIQPQLDDDDDSIVSSRDKVELEHVQQSYEDLD